jgi:hypothetical protein
MRRIRLGPNGCGSCPQEFSTEGTLPSKREHKGALKVGSRGPGGTTGDLDVSIPVVINLKNGEFLSRVELRGEIIGRATKVRREEKNLW